jgi:hypothetical protein
MLRHAIRETLIVDWEASRVRTALPCIVPIAVSLIVGLMLGHPAGGMVAAGGAMSVGFGSFQRLGRSRVKPMWLASLGMGAATAIGSLVSHWTLGVVLNGAALGFIYGWLTALGPGAAWIALQCAIFGLVATGYPASLRLAMQRAALVLAGGLLQMLVVILFRKLHALFAADVPEDPFSGFSNAARALKENFRWPSDVFQYAIRLAATLAFAAFAARRLALSNGYWVPMTTLLILRTDPRETYTRGFARMAGTVVGAGLATLLVSALHPDAIALIALVIFFAWLCYSVVNVNYGAFSVSVTAYIAFLLALGGLPEKEVAVHRVANTLLGGGIALVASLGAHVAAKRKVRII